MDKKELVFGFALLLVTAVIGVVLAEGSREAWQRVVYVNGFMLMMLCMALVERAPDRTAVLFREELAVSRPTLRLYGLVVACAAVGWLSTSLLLSDMSGLTWFRTFAGLLTYGCTALYLRWRFASAVPFVLAGVVFITLAFAV